MSVLIVSPLKLDLACGNHLQEGFTGVDLTTEGTQATIAQDLLTFPWPFESNSIEEVVCSHFLEHIPKGDSAHDPLFAFMDELWRILTPGGTVKFICPYYTSVRAWQDPTHHRVISEPMFFYFDHEWRKVNALLHYPIHTNFKVEKIEHAVSEEYIGRPQEAIQYAANHYWNVILDITVLLKKPLVDVTVNGHA